MLNSKGQTSHDCGMIMVYLLKYPIIKKNQKADCAGLLTKS